MTEILYKHWVHEEAARRGVSPHTIYEMVWRGVFGSLRIRSTSRQNNFVQMSHLPVLFKCKKTKFKMKIKFVRQVPDGAIPIKQWLAEESQRDGAVKPHAIFTRLTRGKYPNIERLCVGTKTRANYVRIKA